ncbi:right-handed parallel beta-helix repeat-containing protein [Pelagicoccus mobilis]|uniref:Right-handed parallel beta-helix repeat-containing protein n=1 Tax=Pelagicoccus mobilis TaxID=415221 RepID=A0A934RU47_9BACT|nr:right-handed parallel beta-helix repeat-containing protein [Pelagicoccus mobilis]MBK1877645.1 right-handed parallel beta-helix repeat-containing protein [Pelagicoccus mobilis]
MNLIPRVALVYTFVLCSFSVFGNDPAQLAGIREKGLDGHVYYVSPAGDDSAAGSKESPFGTIQYAAKQLKPGNTLLLREGVYRNTDSTALAFVHCQGEKDRWIRIANAPGENPVLEFDSQRGLAMQGVRYLVLEGIEFDGKSRELDEEEAIAYGKNFDNKGDRDPRYFGVGVRVEADESGNYPHHVIVRNCRIHHTAGGGIALARSDYVLIEANEVFETSYYSPWGESGISIWESSNHDNRRDVYRTIVRNNVCYRNDNKVKFWMMGTYSDGNGIILDALRTNQDILGDGYDEPYSGRILIANNTCFENGGRGINLYESDSMDVVENKLIRNAQRDGMKYEIEIGAVKGCLIEDNVIVSKADKQSIGGYHYEDIRIEGNLLSGALDNGLENSGDNYVVGADTH